MTFHEHDIIQTKANEEMYYFVSGLMFVSFVLLHVK